jgi:hypothetical protein
MNRPTEQLSSVTEMTILKHTQAGSMAAYQPPRSKFMIHDILGGSGSGKFTANGDDRTPSPQAKDLSVFLNSMPEHDDESDCDSSKSCYAYFFNRRQITDPVFKFSKLKLKHDKMITCIFKF